MKIHAMLNFYGEDPDLLHACVTAVCKAGVDSVLALDGPYASYPHEGKLESSREAFMAIADAAGEQGADSIVCASPGVWEGDEVAKRNEMLRVLVSDFFMFGTIELGRDWLLVVDADHMWEIDEGFDLKHHLERTQHNFAEVSFSDQVVQTGPHSWYELRLLMRALPGMKYVGNHYTTVMPDGSSSNLRRKGSASALDLTEHVRVRHLVHERDQQRRAKQTAYYDVRDGQGLETK